MNKKFPRDLACLGGLPLFQERRCVGRPNLCSREKMHAALDQMFDRRWLTNDGPILQEFEKTLQDYLGVRNCVAVCNATIGLQMIYRALGVRPSGGNAVMPSFTFVATAHALAWEGGAPCFCDADPETHLLDLNDMERKIDSDTSMLVGVHTWGQPCHVEALEILAKKYKLPLVFDAAHAFSNVSGSRRIGGFGDAEVFSFHATKFLNTFEGGCITTDNDALAQELRSKRNFGFSGYDQVSALGINGKMSEISAAMGLCMLEEVDALLEVNRKNYDCYHDALGSSDAFKLLELDAPQTQNCQYIVGTVASELSDSARDLLVDVLWQENVLARKYFHPGVHRAEPYRTQQPALSLPGTEELCDRVVVLPTGTAVEPVDIEQIADCVQFVLKNADEIGVQLEKRG